MDLNWNSLTATTNKVFVKKLIDNVYDSSSLLKIFLMDQSVKLLGGERVVEPILYAKNSSGGAYSGFDTHKMEPPENITASEYFWASYYQTISISGEDEDKNEGEAKILNLIGERTQEAELALKDTIIDDIYSGSGSKGIIGLDTAIGTGTYGGINPTDFAGWVSGVDTDAHSYANMVDSSNASYIHKLLRKGFRSCKHLGQKPNLIVTSDIIWDTYEETLQKSATYPKTGRGRKIADAGFDVIEFRNVPMVSDEKIPAGYMYILNTNFLKLRIHPNKNFKFTGFVKPANQDAKAGQIYFKSQLCVNNRRMHYKFSDLANT
jgi:hypothetical protein